MKPLHIIVLMGLLLAVIASAIGVVWARQENRLLFTRLTKLQGQRDDLNVDFGRLELEQATWADPTRIEALARGKLGMINPPPDDIQLIRR